MSTLQAPLRTGHLARPFAGPRARWAAGLVGWACIALAAQAQTAPGAAPGAVATAPSQVEQARVLSTTPIIQQQRRRLQSCGAAGPQAPAPRTGAGAVAGAIVGGAVGHAIGQGGGAVVGALAGAVLGDQAEANSAGPREAVNCNVTETVENVTAYSVVYEYGGRTYTAVMPADPGATVPVQVVPVGTGAPVPPMPAAYGGDPRPPAAPAYPYYVPYPVYSGYPYWAGAPVVVGIGWGYPVYRPHRRWR